MDNISIFLFFVVTPILIMLMLLLILFLYRSSESYKISLLRDFNKKISKHKYFIQATENDIKWYLKNRNY